MKIGDIMTSGVELTSPNASLQEAAKKMADLDVGSLPVGQDDRLVGMITDRDIAVRAVAAGKDIKKCKVRDVMTDKVLYRFVDDDVEDLAEDMAALQVRRMPIVNRDKRLVGIVSVGDIAVRCDTSRGGDTLRAVAAH
ncbi:MAG: CBS domain-containing protein [Alphaproteobacteria bacterium]|nr:CBS domain-containing protein [Alphaproteobacteria bacterium]